MSKIRFVTAADKRYYGRLCGLIGSIHRNCHDFSISVYDLGLHPHELEEVRNVKNVTICEVEKTNIHILQDMKAHPASEENGAITPGIFSWKPVVIKQELDKYEAIIYLDAGTMVMRDLSDLYDYILKEGLWLIGIGDIGWMTTKYVINKLNVTKEELASHGIHAGIQGISRKVYNNYILPCYEYSKEIELFIDDGTAGGGIHSGRHDQTLFSILALRAGLKATNEFQVVDNKDDLTPNTAIFHSRGNNIPCDLKQYWQCG